MEYIIAYNFTTPENRVVYELSFLSWERNAFVTFTFITTLGNRRFKTLLMLAPSKTSSDISISTHLQIMTDSGRTRSVTKWNKLTGRQIAEAIFQETQGDCRLLSESTKKSTSIWGRIGTRLGKEYKDHVDRIWLESTYSRNFQNVKVFFYFTV